MPYPAVAALAVHLARAVPERAPLRLGLRRLGHASCSSLGAAIAFWTLPEGAGVPAVDRWRRLRRPVYTPEKYLQLIVYMMLAFGIGFEFPILLVFLQLVGVVTPAAAARLPPLRHRHHLRGRRGHHARAPTRSACSRSPSRCASSTRSRSCIGRVRVRRRRAAEADGASRTAPVTAGQRRSPSTGSRSRRIEAIDAGPVGAGGRADRVGQDGRGRARRAPGRWPRAARPSTRRRSRRCRTRSSPTWCAGTGADRVGLLTGDNAINGDAPVVVMTTEVLRNMIYAGSPALDGLAWVVLDEVHYLQDAYRGPVWEEVIIHLPRRRAASCACRPRCRTPTSWPAWIAAVAGPTDDGRRARAPGRAGQPLPRRRRGHRRPRAWCRRWSTAGRTRGRAARRRRPPTGRAGAVPASGAAPVAPRPGAPRWSTTSPASDLLPAIYFIFSRNGLRRRGPVACSTRGCG